MNELLAAVSQWSGLLPALLSSGAAGLKAFQDIKAALAANGIAADTAQLEAVIVDAAARKAREDALLGGGQ